MTYQAVENARRFRASKVSATETTPILAAAARRARDERGATPTAYGRRDATLLACLATTHVDNLLDAGALPRAGLTCLF